MNNVWTIKPLEIKTSMLFNSDFAGNTILSTLFFFFLIIDLYLLFLVAVIQIFSAIAEVVIPIRIPIKEAKV